MIILALGWGLIKAKIFALLALLISSQTVQAPHQYIQCAPTDPSSSRAVIAIWKDLTRASDFFGRFARSGPKNLQRNKKSGSLLGGETRFHGA